MRKKLATDVVLAEPKEKFFSNQSPAWVDRISDEILIGFCKENERTLEIKTSDKGVCRLYREIVNTTNEKNQVYVLMIYNVSNPNTLQAASIQEFSLRDNQHLEIHRLLIVRDGIVLDKKDDATIRVLDDEKSSAQGSIHNLKKVHCVINDLRLGDDLVFEYSIVTVFKEEHYLDKKYFRYVKVMPAGRWVYLDFLFKVIQNRAETVRVSERYFRDAQDVKREEHHKLISQGETYTFQRADFYLENKGNHFFPLLEVTTDARWEEISSYLTLLYKDRLTKPSLKDSGVYRYLKLDDASMSLDDKIQAIIEYVQNQIIYLSDAYIMHGHIPQEADTTVEMKAGDCKAKAVLLINLFHTVGVAAEFILVNYAYDYLLSISPPSPFVFNHAIVKVAYEGKDYYVDPTWVNRSGSLENRAQPIFSSYLPIRQGATLGVREQKVVSDILVEIDTHIDLKGNEGFIRINSVYKREAADAARSGRKNKDATQLIDAANKEILSRLQYPEKKDITALFQDAKDGVVSDDKKNNVLRLSYEAQLIEPYQGESNKSKVFKYYHRLHVEAIKNYQHKDLPSQTLHMVPLRYRVNITSDLFVASTPVTKRELVIDNDYFSFSNKKTISCKSVEVVSEYTPKTYGYIKSEDLTKIKKDYGEMNTGNFGVGIVFLTLPRYIWSKWYFRVALVLLAYGIIVAIIAFH